MKRYIPAALTVAFVTPALADSCILMDVVNHRSPCEVWQGEYCEKPPYPNYHVIGRYAERSEAENAMETMSVCKRDLYVIWDLVSGFCEIKPPTHWEPTAHGTFLDHGEDNDRYNVMGQYASEEEAAKAMKAMAQCKPHHITQ